jgi:glycosyltransferase involved in cell wall biosynthesis
MATISLVMIVKNEELVLERAVKSVESIIDEFIICDTGSTDGTRDIIKKYGDLIEFEFEDYVVSKNKALSYATSDYVLFMDADEYVLSGLDKLKQYAEEGLEYVTASIVEREDGSMTYDRIRMWKNSGKWKFEGPGVHEYISGCFENSNKRDPNIRVKHDHSHRVGKEDDANNRFRNYVDILKRAIDKNSNDKRAWFYLGRTYKDLKKHALAVDAYETYLDIPNNHFVDEIWQAHFDIASCYKHMGEYSRAIEYCKRAMKADPRRAEAFDLMGQIYFSIQDWNSAIEWYEKCVKMDVPNDVTLFLDKSKYYELPADNLALCYYFINRPDKAERVTKELMGDSVNRRLANNLWWYRKSFKKIVFLALGETPEPVYGGILEKQGVHGVETTYIELAKGLSNEGHTVFLFCSCDEEHVYEDVYYIPYEKIHDYISLNPDIVITSRWLKSLRLTNEKSANTKKILWFQDMFNDDVKGVLNITDAIVCSSEWHYYYLLGRYGNSIKRGDMNIISLGIRPELFEGIEHYKKDPLKVIYSSNPDRGLYTLLDMWNDIIDRLPNIHLDVYYGWDNLKTWSSSDKWKNKISCDMETAMKKVKEFDNITFKGRLTKKQLADEFKEASLCLYPCNFYETFCLTALETQFAGVPMITTNMGALNNTLSNEFNILISGDSSSDNYKKRFCEETVKLLEDKDRLAEYSKGCREFVNKGGFSWRDVTKEWQKLIWRL